MIKRMSFVLTVAVPLFSITSEATRAESLANAVKYTLSSSPDVLEKAATRLAVDRERQQAQSGYYPSVDLNAGIGREDSENATTRARGTDDVWLTRGELGLSVRQPLFEGFATKHEVSRHTERSNSSAYVLQSQSEQVALRVAEVYIEVLRRQEFVSLARENVVDSHEKTYEQVSVRNIQGVGRGVDVDQARSRLLLAKANLMAEESNLRDAETNYFRVVNTVPKELTIPVLPAERIPASLAVAARQAFEQHPTLKVAAADIESAKQQLEAAKSPFYPNLDLELGATRNNNLDGQKGRNNDLLAMLRMRYNLYAGGRNSARKAETVYRIDEARDIRDRVCRQVAESMRLSWNSYLTLDAQLGYLTQRVESSVSARDNYRSQFTLGQRSLLDLLDSENEVYSAKKALISSNYDKLFSGFRVLASKGELVAALGVTLPPEAEPRTKNLSEVTCHVAMPAQEVPVATPLPPQPKVVEVMPLEKPKPIEEPRPPVIIEQLKEVPVPGPTLSFEHITLQAGALFDHDKADLKPRGMAALDNLAERIRNTARIEGVEIIGHTDNTGSDAYNKKLSVKRAQAVADYIAGRGVKKEMIFVKGMGEEQPVATNKTSAGRQLNRRVEVNIRVFRKMDEPGQTP